MGSPAAAGGVSAQARSPQPQIAGRVADLLGHQAAVNPQFIAVTNLYGVGMTAAELLAAAAELAGELERLARPPGLIIVSLPNSIDAVVAAFAVFRTHHALAMVHPDLPETARRDALESLRPTAQIVRDDSGLRIISDPFGRSKPMWVPPPSVPGLGIALCVLTSGSTGRPRLIAAPHRQILSAVSMIERRLQYRVGDVVAAIPPLSFDYGLYQLLLAITAGATVVIDTRLGSAQGITHAITRCGISVLPLVPSMLRALTSLPAIHRVDTSGVRLITTTGDLLTESDAVAAREAFPSAQVVPMYGLSECKRVAITPLGSERPPHAVGLPLDDMDLVIGGRGTLRGGCGLTGELIVTGPHLTLGYVADPEATVRRFTIDRRSGVRMLRTGDWLRQDQAGWLYWVGRGSDVIKTSGYRLDPAELETAAARSEVVAESGAYGRPSESRGQLPVLAVCLRAGVDPGVARQELADTLRKVLPRWAMPEIEIHDRPLPRTRNGKIDRGKLGGMAAPVPGPPQDVTEPALPQSPIDLAGVPSSRQFISCHTQAFLSTYDLPVSVAPAEFEVMTTIPFGVRCIPADPHRLLEPFLDQDIGLDRACALLGLRIETCWHGPTESHHALQMLDDWLRIGPVLLGPLDLGYLGYHEVAATLRGCDHYVVALGRTERGEFVVRDPEGFVQVELDQEMLVRAWRAEGMPEGRGAFTQRRLVLSGNELPQREEVINRIAGHALDNLAAASAERTGGAGAFRALAGLAVDPTNRRALNFLLPAASYRYRLASAFADGMKSVGDDPGWHRLAALFEEQWIDLSRVHQEIADNGALNVRAVGDREQQIADCVSELRRPTSARSR